MRLRLTSIPLPERLVVLFLLVNGLAGLVFAAVAVLTGSNPPLEIGRLVFRGDAATYLLMSLACGTLTLLMVRNTVWGYLLGAGLLGLTAIAGLLASGAQQSARIDLTPLVLGMLCWNFIRRARHLHSIRKLDRTSRIAKR